MKITALLTPPVAKTMDGVIITEARRSSTGPPLHAGARGKWDAQGDRTRGHRTTDPHGDQKSGKTFSNPPKSHGHTRKGSDLDERESSSLEQAVGNKRRPRPSESSRLKKPPKEYSTPPQARGLLSGTNTRVPEEEGLMVININSSKQSRA